MSGRFEKEWRGNICVEGGRAAGDRRADTRHRTLSRKTNGLPLFRNNMVLLWSANAESSAGPNPDIYGGSNEFDVSKFLFVYKNIIMRGKSDEEKAGAILCHLDGAAFGYYYDTYSHNGI